MVKDTLKTTTVKTLPEAPASATVKVKTANNFEWLFTMRTETVSDLIKEIDYIEKIFVEKNWTPLAQNNFSKSAPKPVNYVEGKLCPLCGEKLVYAETKTGKKFTKCSTQKWDFVNKKSTGCEYVDWSQNP